MPNKPLYISFSEQLIEYINKNLKTGDRLPSERKLAEDYNISRTTVRLAIQELDRLGYVTTLHGSGSFVSDLYQKGINLSGTYSFTDQMKLLGKEPQTRLLDFQLFEADDYLAKQLKIKLDSKIYLLKRLRLADDQPMMYEETYLPVEVFPDLSDDLVASKSLYKIFEENYQQRIHYAEEEILATIVNPEIAEILQVSSNSPGLKVHRLTHSKDHQLIEYTETIARGDKFRYRNLHINK